MLVCIKEKPQIRRPPGPSTRRLPGLTTDGLTDDLRYGMVRACLGWAAMRRLHDEVAKPIAVPATKGARCRHWRLVSLDGSTAGVADRKENRQAFGLYRTVQTFGHAS